MLKKMLFAAGTAYLGRKMMGRSSRTSDYSRSGFGLGSRRTGRRSMFGF